MKRAISFGTTFLLAAALHAQSIAGVWQCVVPIASTAQGLSGGADVGIVFTVFKRPDGPLRGVMSFIHRGNPFIVVGDDKWVPHVKAVLLRTVDLIVDLDFSCTGE